MKWSNVYIALGLSGIASGNILFWYTIASLIGIEPSVLGPVPFLYGMDASLVLLTVGMLFGRMAGVELIAENYVPKPDVVVYTQTDEELAAGMETH